MYARGAMKDRAGILLVALVSMAFGPCGPAQSPAPGYAWFPVPAFGVQVEAPSDSKVQQSQTTAFVGNGTFKLNLFVVDRYSPASAADQQAELQSEPGFEKITSTQPGGPTWRYDYALRDGKAATVARIAPGRSLDCGVYHVAPAVAAAVASACARVKKL
jgi:hypothetical protein